MPTSPQPIISKRGLAIFLTVFSCSGLYDFSVTVTPSGRQFSCDADETVLSAALRAGVILPYGCKNGACGSCKGKVTDGTVVHGNHQQRALTETKQHKACRCSAAQNHKAI
jgi:ferredoxin